MVQTNFTQELVPLAKLTGATYNPREMPEDEMRRLKHSLQEFGFVQPVIARKEDGLIIGGHQRVAAMRLLLQESGVDAVTIDRTKIPVVYITKLDDAKTKLLNLALNKIHGEWDYDKLSELFGSIPDIDPALFEVSGFSAREMEDIIKLTAPLSQTSDSGDIVDVEAGLAEQARRLAFKLDTDGEVELVMSVLKDFGMTGPGNASKALVKLAQSAQTAAAAK